MALFSLVYRMLAQSQNKRLLRRMMLERDKYADIRLSGAVVAERGSPTGSFRRSASSHAAAAAVTPTDDAHRHTTEADGFQASETDAAAATASSNSNTTTANRSGQACLSVSACVVVPAQNSTEALWIDKLRAQEEAYKQSLDHSLSSVGSSDSARRRCESEDDAFDMWDYVCPQLLRPRLANEWV